MLASAVLLVPIASAATAIGPDAADPDPDSACPGQTVSCTIIGSFNLGGDGPQSELRRGPAFFGGTITVGWDAVSAYVSFSVPHNARAGSWDLYRCTTDVAGTAQAGVACAPSSP